jgi:hypothetical protein
VEKVNAKKIDLTLILGYNILYSQEEKEFQQFETWTGSLKEVTSV